MELRTRLTKTETELDRYKYTSLAMQVFECYRRVEFYCIKETLNINDRNMHSKGIIDFRTFKQYLDEECNDETEHYMDKFRQKRYELLGSDIKHIMRKLRNIRNNCAHPTITSVTSSQQFSILLSGGRYSF